MKGSQLLRVDKPELIPCDFKVTFSLQGLNSPYSSSVLLEGMPTRKLLCKLKEPALISSNGSHWLGSAVVNGVGVHLLSSYLLLRCMKYGP